MTDGTDSVLVRVSNLGCPAQPFTRALRSRLLLISLLMPDTQGVLYQAPAPQGADANAGVEGYMRPGCVHVTLQATVAASAVASDGGAHNLRNAIAHLLEREPSSTQKQYTSCGQ